MTLPRLTRPIHKTTLLSQKGEIEFMPFTVAESKVLMMARASDDIRHITDGIRQVISNCLVDKSIDVKQLPMVDLEWLFLQLHARSNGEKQTLYFKCTNPVGSANCDMLLEFQVDLLKVDIVNKDINRQIKLNDDITLIMKLPTFEMMERMIPFGDHADEMLAALCIESVCDAQAVYKTADASTEEIFNFVQQLPLDKYEQIETYLDNCPTIKSVHDVECKKCGYKHKIELEGLQEHFA